MSLPELMTRLNEGAVRLADQMADDAAAMGVVASRLGNGARILDAGVRAAGSHAAARLYAEACTGGMSQVTTGVRPLGPAILAEARIAVDAPFAACLGAQYAGWKVSVGRYVAMGSGPARALAGIEPLFERFPDLRCRGTRTVLLLESDSLPGEEVADEVAHRCGVKTSDLTLIVAPTGSLVGSTQVAARSVETALHKLLELGFDPATIVAGCGACPIAPGHPDGLKAIGRTNDAVLYGAEVSLWTHATDQAIEAILERVPSCASSEHGRLFYDLFREHGDFYRIDPMLFSPARVTFINATTGRVFAAGRIDEPTLLRSFGLTAGA